MWTETDNRKIWIVGDGLLERLGRLEISLERTPVDVFHSSVEPMMEEGGEGKGY